MALSRKDYELIAKVLKNAFDQPDARLPETEDAATRQATVKSIANELAIEFAAGNELFDTFKFLKAAGVITVRPAFKEVQ